MKEKETYLDLTNCRGWIKQEDDKVKILIVGEKRKCLDILHALLDEG